MYQSGLDCLHPPNDQVGSPISLDLVVAENDAVMAVATEAVAYPVGFALGITVVTTSDPAVVICNGRSGAVHEAAEDPNDLKLNLGVEFADGRRASQRLAWISPNGPASLALDRRSRSNTAELSLRLTGSSHYSCRYEADGWISPLPPPGPLTIWVGWPAANLPASGASVDAGRILAAAAKASPLWSQS